MGYNNEHSYKTALVFDCETAPIDGAADFVEPVSAPSNYVKPEAIEKYVQKETAAQVGKCALDPDLCRIVALGLFVDESDWVVLTAQDEDVERALLHAFWEKLGAYPYPRLIGFNVCAFDLPVIVRRSLYLNVPTKPIAFGKYRHPDVDDLMTLLSFDGAIRAHKLSFYAKRLALDVPPDSVSGKDIGQLVADGNWEAVSAHCLADLFTTAALARRLGVMAAEMVL